MNKSDFAKFIDHTLLKAEACKADVLKLCEEARRCEFFSVCVNPFWIETCSKELKGSNVLVCSVAGFPLGANTTLIKAREAEDAVKNGAQEIDMVLNIAELKSKNYKQVRQDIAEVVKASGVSVKVILETCLLNDEEKINACKLVVDAGAKFVKTSTGFSKAGATVADIRLMRKAVGENFGVKASGGIKTLAFAKELILAGANRIGASSSVAMIEEIPS